MPKPFHRITALLLISCFIADSSHLRTKSRNGPSPVPNSEALIDKEALSEPGRFVQSARTLFGKRDRFRAKMVREMTTGKWRLEKTPTLPGPTKDGLTKVLGVKPFEVTSDPSLGKVFCVDSHSEPFKNHITDGFVEQLATFSSAAFGPDYMDVDGFIKDHKDDFSSPALFYALVDPADGKLTGYLLATLIEKNILYLPRMATLQTDGVRGRGKLLLIAALMDMRRRRYAEVRFHARTVSLAFYFKTLQNNFNFIDEEGRFIVFLNEFRRKEYLEAAPFKALRNPNILTMAG